MRVQEVRGLVLVNPATSYERSNLARFGPICAALQGPLLYPLYILSLVGFAALVLTPTYQAPAFISMLAATKIPTLLNNPYREAWLGRVALGAFLGLRAPGLEIGPLLAVTPFKPQDLGTSSNPGPEPEPKPEPKPQPSLQSHPPVSAPCVDQSSRCTEWRRAGECTANPAFMLSTCRKSCGACSKQSTGTGLSSATGLSTALS